MKIVLITGGVGNQLFQYVFCRYLQSKGHRVYIKDETHASLSHNGFELNKYFKIDLKPIPKWIYPFLKCYWHFLPKLYEMRKSRDKNLDESRLFFMGYWLNKRFWLPSTRIQFRQLPLNEKNSAVLQQILQSESVSIHVRRGDYLKLGCFQRFGGICTEAYYQQAVSVVEQQVKQPKYFVFSDDIPWSRENLSIQDPVYVEWNQGDDSIYDMYLMSRCKYHIIANSTFGYWGAFISQDPLVVYPKKWFADKPAPDIFPDDWIGI